MWKNLSIKFSILILLIPFTGLIYITISNIFFFRIIKIYESLENVEHIAILSEES
jgi:hypothetical protein